MRRTKQQQQQHQPQQQQQQQREHRKLEEDGKIQNEVMRIETRLKQIHEVGDKT